MSRGRKRRLARLRNMARSSVSVSPGSSVSQGGNGQGRNVVDMVQLLAAGMSSADVTKVYLASLGVQRSESGENKLGLSSNLLQFETPGSESRDNRLHLGVGASERAGCVAKSRDGDRSAILPANGSESSKGKATRRGRRSRRSKIRRESADSNDKVVAGVVKSALSDVSSIFMDVALSEPAVCGLQGYGYLRLLKPSAVSGGVAKLGARPTLRSLLALGVDRFRRVEELEVTLVVANCEEASIGGHWRQGQRIGFLDLVGALPECEVSRAWRRVVGFRDPYLVRGIEKAGYRVC